MVVISSLGAALRGDGVEMTFEDLVGHYEQYPPRVEPEAAAGMGHAHLADWLEDGDGKNTVLSREVRIVLISGGSDREITTTVLWLADVYGLAIGTEQKLITR